MQTHPGSFGVSESSANNIENGSGRLEAECNNIIPELPPTEATQGFSEDDVVQGVTDAVQGTQDFRSLDFQGVGAGSAQSPDEDDDEGSRLEGFMDVEGAVNEVIDLTTSPVCPGHTLEDYEARGLRRPHRKVTADQISKGVLSIDIAGPICGGV